MVRFDGDSPYMLLVAVFSDRRLAEAESVRALWGIEAQRASLDRSGDYARRLFSASRRCGRTSTASITRSSGASTGEPAARCRQHVFFNVRGEPIVCTPDDAVRCFRRTHGCAGARKLHPRTPPSTTNAGRRFLAVNSRLTELSDRRSASHCGVLGLLMNLTRREVKGRYSQSLFGPGWAIARPLATMAVFTLVFARLGAMPSGVRPIRCLPMPRSCRGSSFRTGELRHDGPGHLP
jgi:hypothetical protein